MKETYLSGGLYVSFDGWRIKLRAPRISGVDHEVFLDSSVLESFLEYVEALRGKKVQTEGKEAP